MPNAILKSLSAENFASFAKKVCFTTETTTGKEFMFNTFSVDDARYNKVSFLYGANGSGKTYFCKIIREIQRMLAFSPFVAISGGDLSAAAHFKGLDSPVRTFAFNNKYSESPTSFSIDIVLDGTTYHYEFSVKGRIITNELLTKKRRRTEILLNRTSPSFKDIDLRSDFKPFDSVKHLVKEEALCLPIASLLNIPLAEKLVESINAIQVVNMTAAKLSPASNEDAFSEERIEKYVAILQKADPTLVSLDVSLKEEETPILKGSEDDFESREIIATKMTVSVQSKHAAIENGQVKESNALSFFGDESLGTIKLFTMLPHLFNILESGGVLVVDEIENGLHLSLVREIINLFSSDKTNPHNAQLICTSHQPLLLSGEFRRDQVWVVSKDTSGNCSMHRLSEMQISKSRANLTIRILENAFGCNPESFFENNI